MKNYAFIILGGLLGLLYGCGSAGSVIDSLSNNSSGDMVRGVKLQAGTDMSGGSPVPSVTFTMGSLARKGKADRTVMVIDNNTTDIVSENYNVEADYENVDTDIEIGELDNRPVVNLKGKVKELAKKFVKKVKETVKRERPKRN